MSVLRAVERDLKEIRKVSPAAASSALAAVAKALAKDMDDLENSATARAQSARQLRETLDALRMRAPARKESDRVDEIAKRRAKRVGRAAS